MFPCLVILKKRIGLEYLVDTHILYCLFTKLKILDLLNLEIRKKGPTSMNGVKISSLVYISFSFCWYSIIAGGKRSGLESFQTGMPRGQNL